MEVKLGDVFMLGRHRLMCGDSLSLIDMQKLLNKEKVDMVLCDPPYGINYQRDNHSWKHDYKGTLPTNEIIGDIDFNMKRFLDLLKTIEVKGACYLCCSTGQIGTIGDWVFKHLKQDVRQLIWYKSNMSISRSDYHRRYESIMYFWFPGKKFRGEKSGENTDVWFVQNRRVDKYQHPTQKPVRLFMKAIENSSDEGDIVLDPFGGSGTTLIACERLNRKALLMEMDPIYCKVILERYESMTGQKPERIHDHTSIESTKEMHNVPESV